MFERVYNGHTWLQQAERDAKEKARDAAVTTWDEEDFPDLLRERAIEYYQQSDLLHAYYLSMIGAKSLVEDYATDEMTHQAASQYTVSMNEESEDVFALVSVRFCGRLIRDLTQEETAENSEEVIEKFEAAKIALTHLKELPEVSESANIDIEWLEDLIQNNEYVIPEE